MVQNRNFKHNYIKLYIIIDKDVKINTGEKIIPSKMLAAKTEYPHIEE